MNELTMWLFTTKIAIVGQFKIKGPEAKLFWRSASGPSSGAAISQGVTVTLEP